jgi:cardiolipin synthase (CMP-forming)
MNRHLPNLLSTLRLLAAPIAAYLILRGHDIAALLIFAAAGASDGLDGYIARRWGVTSVFGAWLDPAADKLLVLLCFMALFVVGMTPLWLVAAVVARDLTIAAGWLMVKLFNLPVATSPLIIGKASTMVQLLFVFAALLLMAFDVNAPRLLQAAACVCALFTILSAAAYGGVFLRGFFAGSRIA